MVELKREDIEAALLLSWLKYTPVTEEDVINMKHIAVLYDKQSKNSKRKLVRIIKTENPQNPEVQLPKKVRKLLRNSSGSSSADGAELPRRRRRRRRSKISDTHEASGVRNFNSVKKRMMNLSKISSGSSSIRTTGLPKFPPILNLRTLIGKCSNPYEKQLTKTDVDEHQGRLLLNNEIVRKYLLPLLNGDTENLADGIEVKTFDPMGNFYSMRFKTWGNYKSYVLVGSWNQLIKEHNLKERDYVTVWMFRHNQTGELCFALTYRKEEEEDGEEEEKIQEAS